MESEKDKLIETELEWWFSEIKSDRKTNTYDITYMWNLKKLIDTENILVVARSGGVRVGKMGEGDQKVQTSSY